MTDEWNINGNLYGSIHSSIQNDDIARMTHSKKNLAMLLATKPPLQRGIKHWFGLFQGEEVEERRAEGELKLRMQKLQ